MSKRPTLRELQAAMAVGGPLVWRPKFMDKKPRAVSTKPRRHVEHDTQAQFVKWLAICCPDVIVSASLNGELWAAAKHMPKGVFFGWLNKLKARGMLSGEMDLRLDWCGGLNEHEAPIPRSCLMECKTKDGKEAEHQEHLRKRREAMGFGVYIVRTLEDVQRAVAIEGIPYRAHQP